MVILYILLLIVGFAALIKGADWFVDGSSNVARLMKVPGVIVGLTIVAMGTSAPELAVSTSAALAGSNEIALSNVVGSNMFNLLCVLGVCAIIQKVPVDENILKRDFPICILITIMTTAVIGFPTFRGRLWNSASVSDTVGEASRPLGIALLMIFVFYIVFLVFSAMKHPVTEKDDEKLFSVGRSILLILVGIALIVGGGQAVVNSAKEIARIAGMSETLIGLTIVAVGTSLPELVTSVVAAGKGETGMAVGNVVGSNLFNLLLILGVSSTIHPIGVNLASVYDLLILSIVTVVTYLFSAVGRSVKRAEGFVLVMIYVGAVIFAALR